MNMTNMFMAAAGTALVYFPVRALICGSERTIECYLGILFGVILLSSAAY